MFLDTLDALGVVGATRQVVLAAPEDDGVAVLRTMVPKNWEVIAQHGTDLGERLRNGFSDLAPEGPVVLVDSDSPTLPIAPLAEALSRFWNSHNVLLGPCDDGGYYLIGLTSIRSGELGVLSDIPWSTSGVLAATRKRCHELRLDVTELPVWYDVDDAASLARFSAELSATPERAARCTAVLAARSETWTA